MSDDLTGDVLRGISRITPFLRALLDEPELTEKKVNDWTYRGKIPAWKVGADVISTKEALRKRFGGESAWTRPSLDQPIEEAAAPRRHGRPRGRLMRSRGRAPPGVERGPGGGLELNMGNGNARVISSNSPAAQASSLEGLLPKHRKTNAETLRERRHHEKRLQRRARTIERIVALDAPRAWYEIVNQAARDLDAEDYLDGLLARFAELDGELLRQLGPATR
jgi:hypothetical protein